MHYDRICTTYGIRGFSVRVANAWMKIEDPGTASTEDVKPYRTRMFGESRKLNQRVRDMQSPGKLNHFETFRVDL